MVKKICPICQTEFQGKSKQKYCCFECSVEATKKRIKKICPICQTEFETIPSQIKIGKGKYCSPECQRIASRKYNEIVIKEEHAEIKVLHKGEEFWALIDKEDIEKCNQHNWTVLYCKDCDNRYLHTQINRKWITLHRFVTDCPEDKVVDHINHNTLDNRKVNLNICTIFENNKNSIRAKFGVAGVYKVGNRWRVRIGYKGKNLSLGNYDTFEEAVQVRKKAEKKYYNV